jgi:predicted nuclease with TOPRIM domain
LEEMIADVEKGHEEIRAEHTEIRAEHTEIRAEHTEIRAEHTEIRAEHEEIREGFEQIAKDIELEKKIRFEYFLCLIKHKKIMKLMDKTSIDLSSQIFEKFKVFVNKYIESKNHK